MTEFVIIQEAACLEGVTPRAIEINLKIGRYQTRLADSISANGRRKRLIGVNSLSVAAQIRYFKVEEEAKALPSAKLLKANERARREALRILPIVREALEIRVQFKRPDRPGNVFHRLAKYADAHGTTVKSLYRWMRAYKRDGFAGLIPKDGTNRGSRVHKQVLEAIQTTWLQPTQPSQMAVYEKVAAFCFESLLPCPSYKTVQRVIRYLPNAVEVYHRSGRKKWLSDCGSKETRDMSEIAVNEWWNSDHREFDVFVRAGNKIVRPWLTTWMDMASRKAVGRCISLQPNSRTVAVSFRQGVLTHGRPRHVYKDNGKDYACHYLNGKTKRFGPVGFDIESQGVFADLNIEVHNTIPYSAWSKPIERWHGNIPKWERTLPGWCGKDNKERPEKLAREIRDGKLLALDQFTELFDQWLDEYNNTFHSSIGCTPNEMWEDAEREIPDERALDLLLMEGVVRKVHPSGIRVFPPRWHWCEDLAKHVGDKVTVRYDINEVGRVFVFLGRVFLCTAVNKELLRMGVAKEHLKESSRRKRREEKGIREAKKNMFIIPDDDTRLAAIIEENKQRQKEDEPQPMAEAPGMRLVTKFDGQAREIDEAPALDKDLPTPAEQAAAVVDEEYEAMREREFIEMRRRQEEQKKRDEEERMRIFYEPTGADLQDD